MIELNSKQQRMLDEANKELQDGIDDTLGDNPGMVVEDFFFDAVEAAAWEIKDPAVRKEFHRRHGAYDRKTGYDPMAGV